MAILPRFNLTSKSGSQAGVSSYRNTLHATLSRLINNTGNLTDEQWFNMVASLLNGWFVFEREFVAKESLTLLEILQSRDLLQIKQGLRND